MKPYLLAGAAVVASVGLAFAVTPPHSRVIAPGALNPDVTQASIATTICVSGWTATVRPPAAYTTALKKQQIATARLSDTRLQDYEEDHLVPLELGGAPRNPRNLWPELWPDAHRKDALENTLHRQVCAGTLSLAAAQRQIKAWPR